MKFRWPCPTACLSVGDLPRIAAEFERTYAALYGRKGPDVPLEVINWRVVASGPQPDMKLKLPRNSTHGGDPRKGSRMAFFAETGGYVETAIYDRYALDRACSSPVRPSSKSASRL